jgi:hypothetical protein
MSIGDLRTSLARPWAGLAVGPACWALDTQTNYALVQWACHGKWNALPVIAGVLAAVSLIGALSSWFAWHRHDGPGFPIPEQDGHPHHLLSGLGMAAGVLFALVILMQGIGALVLDPCLR